MGEPDLPRREDDPTPGLVAPSWVDRVREIRFLEQYEKYRSRIVHPRTGLPFEPTRGDGQFSIEKLAFQTGEGFRLALKLFMPVCTTVFLLTFLWDWHGIVRACAVGGIIGFGTNWIAIKMLFWPREMRPVFGHGLIPSQRDMLVDKVATEVLENLINEELILRKIEETRIIQRFSGALIDKLRSVTREQEFKDDLRDMVLTYVGELAKRPEFRARLSQRAEASLEEFAGQRFAGWMVRRLRELWRGPLVDVINRELERLDRTLAEGMGHLDDIVERLPLVLEERHEQIDRVLTAMLVGLVREVDVRAIVYEQLDKVTVEQLETGFREFSDDKLAYITLLGGVFGVIGGTVIVFPIGATIVLLCIAAALAGMDVLATRVMRTAWWRRMFAREGA
jgi:hypothetical protein